MRSKTIVIVLLILSFNILHDSLIVTLEQETRADMTYYVDSQNPMQDSSGLNEIHDMFHFMAIFTPYKGQLIHFSKEEKVTRHLLQYSLPHIKTAYKPPIV